MAKSATPFSVSGLLRSTPDEIAHKLAKFEPTLLQCGLDNVVLNSLSLVVFRWSEPFPSKYC